MTPKRTESRSPYMEWAKLQSHARFNLSSSGVPNFPLSQLPARIEDLELTGGAAYGYPPLQQRIAGLCGVDPDCVVAAAGTSMANHLAMAATVELGDDVLIEHPNYELLVAAAQYLGARISTFPRHFENGFWVDPDEVALAITSRTRLIVISNLHNPSGVLTNAETLRRIGEIARGAGARVLVDEVYLDFVAAPAPRTAFHLGNEFIVTNSLTKVYGLSGLRCGWILAEPSLAHRMWRLNDLFGVAAAHPAERLSVVALDNLGPIREASLSLLEQNRKLLKQFVDSTPEIQTVWPEAGTVIFPRLLRGSVNSLCELLRERYETAVVPGHFFGMPNYFRIGIGGETQMIAEALNRLKSALQS